MPANPELTTGDPSGDTGSTLVRGARVVPVGGGARAHSGQVDIRMSGGHVVDVAPSLTPTGRELVIDALGRWAIPGLWDQHVHLTQLAQTSTRLDVSGTAHPQEVARVVGDHLAQLAIGVSDTLLVGSGFRSAAWEVQPTVADLDAVSGDHRVVLISGDVHSGWLNSNALRFFGLAPRTGPLDENEWFSILSALSDLPETLVGLDDAYRQAVQSAASLGVVGVADLEFGAGYLDWPRRFAAGVDQLRVRPATYADHLEEVIAAGLRTGDALPGGAGLLTMGPLKIISDGSLNTRTASCCEPYLDSGGMEFLRGKQNHTIHELVGLLSRAHACGLEIALHALGDAAVRTALDAFAATGAAGGIEHAQLVRLADLPRMAALGVRASVQPAHLLDDRDVAERYWPDRTDRCFAFQSMVRAGVTLALGSDAPVAPLDPWLAMAAAVHRSRDDRAPWHAAEALTAAQALAASTDGQTTLAPGSRGDIVLLDDDPLMTFEDTAAAGKHLRSTRVAATLIAGRPTHLAL